METPMMYALTTRRRHHVESFCGLKDQCQIFCGSLALSASFSYYFFNSIIPKQTGSSSMTGTNYCVTCSQD
jgi:hypothetical protein